MTARSKDVIPALAYAELKELGSGVVDLVTDFSTELDGDISAERLQHYIRSLFRKRQRINALLSTPRLDAYAQSSEAENDPTYSATTEYGALVSAMDAAWTTVRAIPVSTLLTGYTAEGFQWAVLSTVTTAQLKTDFDAIVAAG